MLYWVFFFVSCESIKIRILFQIIHVNYYLMLSNHYNSYI